MAVLIPAISTCSFETIGERRLAERLEQKLDGKYQCRLPSNLRKRSSDYEPNAKTIKILTTHVSKGLECPGVARAGVWQMPGEGEYEREEARLFYVEATSATHRQLIWAGGNAKFRKAL